MKLEKNKIIKQDKNIEVEFTNMNSIRREKIKSLLTVSLERIPKKYLPNPIQLTASFNLVDEKEITALNGRFRNINQITNVLSFPSGDKESNGLKAYFLGDVILCEAKLQKEAISQRKNLEWHFLHLCLHGFLHLIGYRHTEKKQAKEMENLEIEILKSMGIKNPYI